MKAVIGLLWAFGGAVLGFAAGVLVAMAVIAATGASNREGGHGYLMMGLGLVGAVLGIVAGLLFYGRSAPSGASLAYFGSGTLGVAGVIAAAGLGLWAYMYLQERPVQYEGAMADLEMELRIETAKVPLNAGPTWFGVEVQTSSTRPVGLVLWDKQRIEGTHTILPVIQGPLYRAGSRVIVVNVSGQQSEAFLPPMKRTPDPKAGWSEWFHPQHVDPPYDVVPSAPLKPLFELRYKIRKYGDE